MGVLVNRYIKLTFLLGACKENGINYMLNQSFAYPVIPEDTLRAATKLYGKGNIYMRLGDRLEGLLNELRRLDLKPWRIENQALETTIQCALLTVFQYVEQLANTPILEALHSREDLKYALHLPLNNLSITSEALCKFRQRLLEDSASLQLFQNLLEHLAKLDFLTPDPDGRVDSIKMLSMICSINRFDEVLEAMYRALESLAVTDPEWLRGAAHPYWYDRYNRKRRLNLTQYSEKKWKEKSIQIATDIQYLLEKVDQSQIQKLASLEAIKELKQLWGIQEIASSNNTCNSLTLEWRLAKCVDCMMQTVAREVQCKKDIH